MNEKKDGKIRVENQLIVKYFSIYCTGHGSKKAQIITCMLPEAWGTQHLGNQTQRKQTTKFTFLLLNLCALVVCKRWWTPIRLFPHIYWCARACVCKLARMRGRIPLPPVHYFRCRCFVAWVGSRWMRVHARLHPLPRSTVPRARCANGKHVTLVGSHDYYIFVDTFKDGICFSGTLVNITKILSEMKKFFSLSGPQPQKTQINHTDGNRYLLICIRIVVSFQILSSLTGLSAGKIWWLQMAIWNQYLLCSFQQNTWQCSRNIFLPKPKPRQLDC